MADPLSIAAAAAGFASLAGQLVGGIATLNMMYQTISNAPAEARDLLAEMDFLGSLLATAGERIQQNPDANIQVFKAALDRCETVRYRLEGLMTSVDLRITRRRAQAARMFFKRDTIQELLLSIERAKSDLLLAQQYFEADVSSRQSDRLMSRQSALLKKQEEVQLDVAQMNVASALISKDLQDVHAEVAAILARISEKRESVVQIEQSLRRVEQRIDYHVSNPDQQRGLHTSTTTTRTTFSFSLVPFAVSLERSSSCTVVGHSQQSRHRGANAAAHIFRLRLPRWYARQRAEVLVRRATSGWLFTMCVQRTVHYESPFFEACRSGDLNEIRRLLSVKEAYITDRPDRGLSAICIAAVCDNLDVVAFLKEHGALELLQETDYMNVLRSLAMVHLRPLETVFPRLKLLQPSSEWSDSWYLDVPLDRVYRRSHRELLRRAEQVSQGVKISALSRYEAMFLGLPTARNNNIGEELLDEVCRLGSSSGYLLFIVIQQISSLLDKPQHFQVYLKLVSTIIRTGANMHCVLGSLDSFWSKLAADRFLSSISYMYPVTSTERLRDLAPRFTPFMLLLIDEYVRDRHNDDALRCWAKLLFDAGVDLQAYGLREMMELTSYLQLAGDHKLFCGFDYGRSPSEWRLWSKDPVKAYPDSDYVGEFWKSVVRSPDLIAGMLQRIKAIKATDEAHLAQEDQKIDIPGSWQEPRYERPRHDQLWLDDLEDWLLAANDVAFEQIVNMLDTGDPLELYRRWELEHLRLEPLPADLQDFWWPDRSHLWPRMETT